MTLSCRLAGYASTCDARALDASPVFLRALAECLRQAATGALPRLYRIEETPC